MPIEIYPSVAKAKRNNAWQNLPGFVQQSGDADIEAMIANKETRTTAQFAHAKDSFFILNDVLYQADENIPVNGTIAVGTNCHVSVIGDEILELINETTSQSEMIDDLKITQVFSITNWKNGWIRTSGYIGSIGSDTKSLVSGVSGTSLVQKGDGKSYKTSVADGWEIVNIGEYSGTSQNTFVRFLDNKTNITLSANMYYVFEISKVPAVDITVSDLTNETIIVYNELYTDTTLSISGKAADAKIVGDKILELTNETTSQSQMIDELNTALVVESHFELINWQNGYIRSTGYVGSIGSDPEQLVSGISGTTVTQLGDGNTYHITLDEGWVLVKVAAYSSNTIDSYIGTVDISENKITLENSKRYIFQIAKDPIVNISPSDLTENTIVLTRVTYTDNTLTLSGKAADAKIVGEAFLTPLTSLSPYIAKNLAYKPLGQLEKPYLCLVSDDGNELLNTYTIPMVLNKGVPCTFALMSASDVMQTQVDIDIVKNAITNGECSVAQHGEHYWTTYTEKTLNQFFDTEKTFFDSVGITLEGAVLPGHYANDMVLALAGGRFGIVRSGYSGEHGGTFINYNEYASGARSNLFCLTSYNIADYSLDTHKSRIDYAVANNKMIIVYWHENSMTDSNKTILEGLIDYAKTTSINFCTIGDILKNVV